jgi:hypothetical protein
MWNSSSNMYEVERKSVRYTMDRWRIQVAFIRHFQLDNPNLDVYTSMAMGANIIKRKYYLDGQESSPNVAGMLQILPYFPISMRFTLGMRYFFTERFGVQTEVSLGGPLLNIGFAARL